MSKQQINERAYMQKVAGIITESEYEAIMNEEEHDAIGDMKRTGQKPKDDNEKFLGKDGNAPRILKVQKSAAQSGNTADVDTITQGLIDGGYFKPQEVPSGEMLNSMTKGKLKHNEEIRNAINAMDGLDYLTKEKYSNKFY